MVKKAVYDKMIRRVRELEKENEELLQSVDRATGKDQEKHLFKVRALVNISMEIMAENTIDGLLQCVVDGARKVTGARLATSAHGYRDKAFRVGAASRSGDYPACPPGKTFCGSRGGVYLDLIENKESLRLSDEELRSHPLWCGLPEVHAPLRGLLGVRLVGRDGTATGLIMVSDKENGDFTMEDELLLVQLGTLASLAAQHIEARLNIERKALEMETVFSTLTDAVMVLDESGRIVESNPASRAAYGFDPAGMNCASIQGKIILSHLDGNEVPFKDWPINKALLGHTIIKERLMLRDTEGRVSFVAATACPLLLEGKLSGGVQVLHNVTEEETLLRQLYEARENLELRVKERTEDLERANTKLNETKALLEKTFEALDQAVFIIDPSARRILSCNRTVEQIFGYTQDELVGRNMELLHTSKEMEIRFGRELFETLDREGVYRGECRMRRKDGSVFSTEYSAGEIRDDAGKRHAVVSVLRDISERKRMEEKIVDYMNRLERSNLELQSFAFVASHDLQEPLRKIQTFGNMLEAKYALLLDDYGRDYIRRMINAAGRMQALIKGLLSYSRIRTTGLPFKPVSLNEVVQEVLSNLEVRLEQTGACVEVDGLPTLDGDAVQMGQLFQNLIGNSLKFGAGRKGLVVKIHSETTGGSIPLVRIIVKDNGIGFDMKFADLIFQPFERLHGRSAYEGVGMGLAICRKIVERHRGTIEARSAPQEGATFVVTLPMKQPRISHELPGH
jgi:PAS domain S-box-containing protein